MNEKEVRWYMLTGKMCGIERGRERKITVAQNVSYVKEGEKEK